MAQITNQYTYDVRVKNLGIMYPILTVLQQVEGMEASALGFLLAKATRESSETLSQSISKRSHFPRPSFCLKPLAA